MNGSTGFPALVIAFLFFSTAPGIAEPASVGVYPVPVAEMEEQVADWLRGEGCRVVREDPDDEA